VALLEFSVGATPAAFAALDLPTRIDNLHCATTLIKQHLYSFWGVELMLLWPSKEAGVLDYNPQRAIALARTGYYSSTFSSSYAVKLSS
jgi:hypothetical protein